MHQEVVIDTQSTAAKFSSPCPHAFSASLVLSLMGSLEKDGGAGTFLSPVVYQGLELPATLKDHICSNMHDITEVEVIS